MTDAKNLVAVSQEDRARTIAIEVARAVAELPDRSSPDDWPDAMLVTAEELIEIVCTELRHHEVAASAPSGEGEEIARLREALEPFAGIADTFDEFSGVIDTDEESRMQVVQAHGCMVAELDAEDFRRAQSALRGGKSG